MIVKVGQPPKFYPVNEKIICASSDYFLTRVKPNWFHGKRPFVDLTEDDPHLFNIYVNWLYGGMVFAEKSDGNGTLKKDVFRRYFDLYALGDKLLDSGFKDAIIDASAHHICGPVSDGKSYLPREEVVNRLYSTTMAGCTLRRLVVAKFGTVTNLSEVLSDEHESSFLRDVALAKGKYNAQTLKAATTGCDFHEHAQGKENCYRTKRG